MSRTAPLPHTDYRDLLAACVDVIAPGCAPRSGQARLCDDIASVILPSSRDTLEPGFLVGAAPVGVGKTLAELVPAWMGALQGQRTVISTDSLALQAQILGKDAPVVGEAAARLGVPTVGVAVYKGWSNYACLLACATHVAGVTRSTSDQHEASVDQRLTLMEATLAGVRHPSPVDQGALWAVRQAVDGSGTGDRHVYDGDLSGEEWARLSIHSGDCPSSSCPFISVCLPRHARDTVREASIIVTNHTLLAIQASTGVPVVTGSKKLGGFSSIIVDECHALPGHVRAQGSHDVSGLAFQRFTEAIQRLSLPGDEERRNRLVDEGRHLAGRVKTVVDGLAGPQGVCEIGEDARPLDVVAADVGAWLARTVSLAREWMEAQPEGSAAIIPLARVLSRADKLGMAVQDVNDPPDACARWVERIDTAGRNPLVVVKMSPVDVSARLAGNVWRTPGSGLRVNVVCMSATVPPGFGVQVGVSASTVSYESAFTGTYASNTVLTVPGAPAGVLEGSRLNLPNHQTWAGEAIVRLVQANGGSALVLAATTANGQAYARCLRQHWRGSRVLSQWDGKSTRLIVDQWKQDTGSVLVGTRSLMTGVDAPGVTNTLVIVDRVPRAAPNPVDDARVKDVSHRHQLGRWDADRVIYYGDARILLQQALGRLIRSVSDTGMAVILDPRLASGPGAYTAVTKGFLLKAAADYTTRLDSLDEAVAWLTVRRSSPPATVEPAGTR